MIVSENWMRQLKKSYANCGKKIKMQALRANQPLYWETAIIRRVTSATAGPPLCPPLPPPLRITVRIILAFVVALLMFPTTQAYAASNGRIFGQLLNGTKNNAPVAAQSVTLQMAQGNTAKDLKA